MGQRKRTRLNRTRLTCRKKEDQHVRSKLPMKIISAAIRQEQEWVACQVVKIDRAKRWLQRLNPDDCSYEERLVLPTDICYKRLDIPEEFEATNEMFMSDGEAPQRTLGDLIWEATRRIPSESGSQLSNPGAVRLEVLNQTEKEIFGTMRYLLMMYRRGKLPETFEIIPKLRNWEQILNITEPCTWSAAAMYEGTRIFTSNVREHVSKQFLSLVLLPRIRDDISEHKRLNFHLYEALRKASYKPLIFISGFLVPLLESGNCTLQEAIIVGSVIARNSLPVLHSSFAMQTIAEMDYTVANSIFLKIFLDKKYVLPYRVVDALVAHFLRVGMEHRELPIIWHQAFLSFAQRYKDDISMGQKDALLELVSTQNNRILTPAIRRELENAQINSV